MELFCAAFSLVCVLKYLIKVIITIITYWEFSTPASTDSLSPEFEWQQVSRTLLSIQADLNNVVV